MLYIREAGKIGGIGLAQPVIFLTRKENTHNLKRQRNMYIPLSLKVEMNGGNI
jgi:hypothetical protein